MEASLSTSAETPTEDKRTGVFRTLKWAAFSIFCLFTFTLWNFPDAKVKAWIQTSLNNELSSRGMGLSAQNTSLSMLFGIRYKMTDATLILPPPQSPVKISTFSVSPSLLSLIMGKVGGSLYIKTASGGELDTSFSAKIDPKTGTGPVSIDADLKDLNLGQLGVLSTLAGIKASMIANGNVSFTYNAEKPATSSGKVSVKLSKVQVDAQSISSFSIPALSISQSDLQIEIVNGVIQMKNVQIGKVGSTTDDLIANLTGDITLARTLENSQLKLGAKFSLSQSILKAFAILDAIMGGAKLADGSYSYSIKGSFSQPEFVAQGNSSK